VSSAFGHVGSGREMQSSPWDNAPRSPVEVEDFGMPLLLLEPRRPFGMNEGGVCVRRHWRH
jgi:hypothetical protein